MLRIRPEQMAALQAAVIRANFEDAMLPAARRGHPQLADVPDVELRGRIRRAADRARGHGATSPEALGVFVDLSLALGEEFDREPWAAQALADRATPDANVRIEGLIAAGARAAGETLPGGA